MLNTVPPNHERLVLSGLEMGAPGNRCGSIPQDLQLLCQMLLREAAFSEDLGFMALDDISQLLHRSGSWMYQKHLVPIYGPDGSHVNADKVPSFPWEQLPAPCVKVGKKIWSNADIRAWVQRFVIRASSHMGASRAVLEVDHE